MSIQRYWLMYDGIDEDDQGEWVKYEDHQIELDVAYWTGYNAAKAEKEQDEDFSNGQS